MLVISWCVCVCLDENEAHTNTGRKAAGCEGFYLLSTETFGPTLQVQREKKAFL